MIFIYVIFNYVHILTVTMEYFNRKEREIIYFWHDRKKALKLFNKNKRKFWLHLEYKERSVDINPECLWKSCFMQLMCVLIKLNFIMKSNFYLKQSSKCVRIIFLFYYNYKIIFSCNICSILVQVLSNSSLFSVLTYFLFMKITFY